MDSDILVCPRDGAALETTRYEAHIDVDVCPACRGMWLDKGELEAIEAASDRDYTAELAARTGAEPQSLRDIAAASERGPIHCPRCGGDMEAREYGFASRITIDSCVAGCGVWLDEGEIQALEEFFERNRGNVTVPLRYRLWASVLSVWRRG